MPNLPLILMCFASEIMAQGYIQLHCGNDWHIKGIQIKVGGDFEGVMMRDKCENSKGNMKVQPPIRYATSGDEMWIAGYM